VTLCWGLQLASLRTGHINIIYSPVDCQPPGNTIFHVLANRGSHGLVRISVEVNAQNTQCAPAPLLPAGTKFFCLSVALPVCPPGRPTLLTVRNALLLAGISFVALSVALSVCLSAQCAPSRAPLLPAGIREAPCAIVCPSVRLSIFVSVRLCPSACWPVPSMHVDLSIYPWQLRFV
jgi:hypothetical protein